MNPRALAAYGLAIDDIRTDITNQNTDLPKGNFDGPSQNSTINNNDQLQTAEDYRRLIVAYKNGGAIRLSDVATVVEGPENSELAAWANRTPAIILNVQRQPGTNVIAVVDSVKALLPKLEQTLPAGLEVSILSDQTGTIRASVADIEFELALAVALVVLVIFLFLRNLPATIIPSLSVPLSLVGTLAGMYLFGFSLDNLSLMSLTIASGFVVDDAIVMIENISRYIERGEAPVAAALRGPSKRLISLNLADAAFVLCSCVFGSLPRLRKNDTFRPAKERLSHRKQKMRTSHFAAEWPPKFRPFRFLLKVRNQIEPSKTILKLWSTSEVENDKRAAVVVDPLIALVQLPTPHNPDGQGRSANPASQ